MSEKKRGGGRPGVMLASTKGGACGSEGDAKNEEYYTFCASGAHWIAWTAQRTAASLTSIVADSFFIPSSYEKSSGATKKTRRI